MANLTATARNDELVLDALKGERARLEARVEAHKAEGYTWTSSAERKLAGAASMSAKALVRETGLSEGKVRGALKRLTAAGLIEVASTSHRWGDEWATAAEMAGLRMRERAERRAELCEQYGTASDMRALIVQRANRIREGLDTLLGYVKDVGDVIDLERELWKLRRAADALDLEDE